jgi:hypothetical protein
MKTRTYQATLPTPNDTQCRVENLRQLSPSSPLTPVGHIEPVCLEHGVPIASWTHPDGSSTLLFQSDSLSLFAYRNGDAVAVGALPALATSAIVLPDGVLIFTSEGNFRASYSDDTSTWSLLPTTIDYPPVAITPEETRTFTDTTAALTLTGNYTAWSGAFTKSDIALLGNTMLDSLSRAEQTAVANGCSVAPILAWYRLRDAAGKVIFRSMPVLVTPVGIQGPEAVIAKVAVSGGAFRAVSPISVDITGFKIGLRIDSSQIADSHRRATTLELLTTPPVDLIDYSATPYITRLSASATEGTLRINVPRVANRASVIPAMLDRLDELSTVEAVYFDPFGPDSVLVGTSPHVIDFRRDLSPATAQSSLRTALKREPEAALLPSIIRESQLPHTFTAAQATLAGDIAALADITPVHALPMPLNAMWTTDTSYGVWRAKVCVSIINSNGDTELLCSETTGEGSLPEAILPMFAYPHPGAFKVDVEVTTPSGTVARTFPLTPTTAALSSCYVAPDMAPISLSTFADTATTLRAVSERKPVRHPSQLLVAQASDPLTPLNAVPVGGGAVTALSEMIKSTSGLAFGRRHIYAFTSAGIHTVSISSGMQLAASMISPAKVASADAVAVGNTCVYAATDTALIAINGTAVTTIMKGRFTALGYSPAFRELWCRPEDADASVVIVDACGKSYQRTDIVPTAFSRNSSTLFISTDAGMCDAGVEDSEAIVKASWRRRICMVGSYVPRVVAVTTLMAADTAEISIDLLGDNGGENPHRFAGIAIVGNIAEAPFLPVLSHPHRYVTIYFHGTVSADASLTSFNIDTCTPNEFIF